jgi:DNA mismatch endonuclease, patch repair protein
MADVFSTRKRSEVMATIRATNTKPELITRRYLFAQGLRFRVHQGNLPGKPDIVLKKYNTVIFVNGCFWHGHKNCKSFRPPKSRTDYWVPKIQKNIANDKKNVKALKKMGWNVICIWECQLKVAFREDTLSILVNRILL